MSSMKRLYYFTSQQYALESLRDKRLKIGRFSELNDPFDFLGIALNNRSQRRVHEERKHVLNATMGIICMSGGWRHPLLWGHYADKHKGICLGFDVDVSDPSQIDAPSNVWRPIDYVETRPTLSAFGVDHPNKMTPSDFARLSLTKFDAWKYEDEFRWVGPLNDADPVTGHHFKSFGPGMVLREVINHSRRVSELALPPERYRPGQQNTSGC